jgi:hypothetical protein
MKPDNTFSVIKFFNLLEQKIAKPEYRPLAGMNLIIQQDAYKRLATNETDHDDEQPIATIDNNRKQKDSDLRFAFDFYEEHMVVQIEELGGMGASWQEFASEQDAANQVFKSLLMLNNGQLAVLLTSRNGRNCVGELLLYAKDDTVEAKSIATVTGYPWWWREKNEQGYDFRVLKNNHIPEVTTPPNKFFMQAHDSLWAGTDIGRTFDKKGLSPLTKKAFRKLESEAILENAGRQPEDANDMSFLFRSWEFWLFGFGYGVGVFALFASNILPDFFDYLGPVFGVLFLFSCGLVVVPLLAYKEDLKKRCPEHWWFKIDKIISFMSLAPVHAAILVGALIATSFMPLYLIEGHEQFINLYVAAQQFPVAYVLIVLIFLPIFGVQMKNVKQKLFVASSLIVTVVGLILFNGLCTNTSVDSPEPYTSILLFTLLGAFVIPAIWLGQLIKDRREKQASNAD